MSHSKKKQTNDLISDVLVLMRENIGSIHQQSPTSRRKHPQAFVSGQEGEKEVILEVHHLYYPAMVPRCLSGNHLTTTSPSCLSPDRHVLFGDSIIAQSCLEFTTTLTQPPDVGVADISHHS